MKTILLCIIASVVLFSCSYDTDFETLEKQSSLFERNSGKVEYPANASNPYDGKGQHIYQALSFYYQNNQTPRSISELRNQLGYISARIVGTSTQTSRLIPFTDELVESIMEDPDNSMMLIVENSVLQNYAKNNLISFLQQLIIKREQEFSITYNYITGYEEEVLDDTLLTAEETETILTVASISRYSLYSADERKDRDWETNVGGKTSKPFFEVNEVPLISIIALLYKII